MAAELLLRAVMARQRCKAYVPYEPLSEMPDKTVYYICYEFHILHVYKYCAAALCATFGSMPAILLPTHTVDGDTSDSVEVTLQRSGG